MPKKFKELNVTIMTLLISFDGKIDIYNTYPLLRIFRTHILPKNKKTSKNFKLTYPNVSGAILSVRCNNIVRGIIKSTKTGSFRNCITIDISNSKKNVNIKLFRNTILMCGATSLEQGIESANLLLNHINEIQKKLEFIRNNREIVDGLIESNYNIIKNNNLLIDNNEKYSDDFFDERNSNLKLFIENNKEELDDLQLYLLEFVYDYITLQDYEKHIEWIINMEDIIDHELTNPRIKPGKASKSMVNYSYDLEFPINRIKLREEIMNYEDFRVSYYNVIDNSVTITLPCKINNDEGKLVDKEHTFMVYKSGKVTQSGPDEKEIEIAYEKFTSIISVIKDKIIKT